MTEGTVPQFITINDLAERLKLSHWYVRLIIDRGELPVTRFGRAVRIREDDVEKWLSGGVIAPIDHSQRGAMKK